MAAMLASQAVLWLFFSTLVMAEDTPLYNTIQNQVLKERYISCKGRTMNITLHWASDPARAASALFAVILRDGLGYQKVVLRESPYLDLRKFAENVPHNYTRRYDEVILALSLAWKPARYPDWVPNRGMDCGLAGPRLMEFGASSVPVQQRVHVHLASHFQNESQCINFTQWSFYTNDTALKQCGFTDFSSSTDHITRAIIYELDSVNTTMAKLKEFAKVLRFEVKTKNRTEHFELLQTGNHSFLFVDYDIWSEYKHVTTMLQPFCLIGSTCLLEPTTAVAMRVGDVDFLLEYGVELLQFANNFTTTAKAIREILQFESEGKEIQQAAKDWVSGNDFVLDWARQVIDPTKKLYQIAVFYCKDDPDFDNYDKLIDNVYDKILEKMYGSLFTIKTLRYRVNCLDPNYIITKVNYFLALTIKQRLIGAVVGSVNNITHVAESIESLKLPVLFYDAVGLATATKQVRGNKWLVTGSLTHLTLALDHFISNMSWTRVAVISEPTETAKRFIVELKYRNETLAFRNHLVNLNLSIRDAENVLNTLKNENAHIILVNTNYKDAATILAAGSRIGMNSRKEYAWILREWRPNPEVVNISHFTFSFWCRCGNDSDTDVHQVVHQLIDENYPNCTWPPHAATLGDAILTLANGFTNAILESPQIGNDLRTNQAIEIFERLVTDVNTLGVTQNLVYRGHSLEETVVFVDEWFGDQHDHLARWRINSNTGKISIEDEKRTAYPQAEQPHDGSLKCVISSGDPYLPACHDVEFIIGLTFLFLLIPLLMLVYRLLRRRIKEHEEKIIYKVLARRQLRAAALSANYLVDRSAVTLRRELGSGRFGYVRLAWLSLPGRVPRYVAAKTLRAHQDESEILSEACILASLHHENIIRLVGVCIDKDPPLVLMEVAFFGDLRQYLQDRRYLVEGIHSELSQVESIEEEVTHVSAEALTRLACQAASALAYLALRRVIHRDLRASNCLVDANRSLKLADFGLAREIKTTDLEIGAEYTSRRRGLFPVLWMAPESLIHGEFSTASDVWAFGVLVFELVTLGSRPFGDMSPLRVMQHVAEGGKPTMPRDATPQTIALTRLCWHRKPEQRPTADNLVKLLMDRPNVLHPAIDDDHEVPNDVDSGCGESPMSEFLPG